MSNSIKFNFYFSESDVAASQMRQVFTTCDSGSNAVSNRIQDLEPTNVMVDKEENMAYILFAVGI